MGQGLVRARRRWPIYLRDALLCFSPEAFRLTFGATGLFPKPVGPTLQGFLLGRMGLRVVVFVPVVRHGNTPQREQQVQ